MSAQPTTTRGARLQIVRDNAAWVLSVLDKQLEAINVTGPHEREVLLYGLAASDFRADCARFLTGIDAEIERAR